MGQLPWGMDTVSLVHVTATVGPKSRGNGGFPQKGRFQVKRAGCPLGPAVGPACCGVVQGVLSSPASALQ